MLPGDPFGCHVQFSMENTMGLSALASFHFPSCYGVHIASMVGNGDLLHVSTRACDMVVESAHFGWRMVLYDHADP